MILFENPKLNGAENDTGIEGKQADGKSRNIFSPVSQYIQILERTTE